MNKNNFSKILAFLFTINFSVFAGSSSNACPTNKIIDRVWEERGSLSVDYRKYLDEVFNFEDGYNLVKVIKSSEEYRNAVKKLDVKISEDSLLFIFVFNHLKNFYSADIGKKNHEFREATISKILSMRKREERRSDKFVASAIDKDMARELMLRYYKLLSQKQ